MIPKPIRKLTLIDGMILVAAAALGFAGVRLELTTHFHPSMSYILMPFEPVSYSSVAGFTEISIAGVISGSGGNAPWFSKAWEWAESARLAALCLAALSLAMLLIRLRHPRPPWPRLIRQAGTVASLGAILALGVRFFHALLKLVLEHFHPTMMLPSSGTGPAPSRLSWIACQTTQPHLIGVVVLASWLLLALGGRHRERGWINRGGIAVGLGWVGLLLFDLFRNEPA